MMSTRINANLKKIIMKNIGCSKIKNKKSFINMLEVLKMLLVSNLKLKKNISPLIIFIFLLPYVE